VRGVVIVAAALGRAAGPMQNIVWFFHGEGPETLIGLVGPRQITVVGVARSAVGGCGTPVTRPPRAPGRTFHHRHVISALAGMVLGPGRRPLPMVILVVALAQGAARRRARSLYGVNRRP